jgi:membrane-associated phospholipid phosphatase
MGQPILNVMSYRSVLNTTTHNIKDIAHRRTLMWLTAGLIFLTGLLGFIKLSVEVFEQGTTGPDNAFLKYLHQFASDNLNIAATVITNLGGPLMIIALTITISVVLYLRRKPSAAAVLMIGVGGAGVINLVLKTAFARVRPSLWTPLVSETSFSFPSGHAMMSSAFILSLTLILWHTPYRWTVMVFGSVFVVLVGLSRLYLGVHYPTDILGGWIMSIVWVTFVGAIIQSSRPFSRLT